MIYVSLAGMIPVRWFCVASMLAASTTLASCSAPKTDIEVIIASDLSTAAFPHFRLRGGDSWDETNQTINGGTDIPYDIGVGTALVSLPTSFAIVPQPGHSLTAVVDNSNAGDPISPPPTLRRIVRVSDMNGVSGSVVIWLGGACLATVNASSATPCPEGLTTCTMSQSCETQLLTCGNDGCCRPIDIDPSEVAPLSDAGPDVINISPPPPDDCASLLAGGGADASIE